MSATATPPDDPRAKEIRARQKSTIYLAMTLLVLGAIAIVALPLEKIPFPVRLLTAAVDLVMAGFLWVLVRQKFDGK